MPLVRHPADDWSMPSALISRRFAIAGAIAAGSTSVFADEAGTAADGVLLRIDIATGSRSFDLAQLDALPQLTFRTSTPWTEGQITFSGPPLRIVLLHADVGELESFVAHALNRYVIEFDPEDIEEDYPIIATRMDGKPLSKRTLGPLWVLYPYDLDSRYRTEDIYSHSIWQLVRIIAKGYRG